MTVVFILAAGTAAGGWTGFHLAHGLVNTEPMRTGRVGADIPGLRARLMPENLTGLLLAAKTGASCRVSLLGLESWRDQGYGNGFPKAMPALDNQTGPGDKQLSQ